MSQNIKKRNYPAICSFQGLEPIICCDEPESEPESGPQSGHMSMMTSLKNKEDMNSFEESKWIVSILIYLFDLYGEISIGNNELLKTKNKLYTYILYKYVVYKYKSHNMYSTGKYNYKQNQILQSTVHKIRKIKTNINNKDIIERKNHFGYY